MFRKSIFGWNCDHDTPLCDTPLLEDTPLCDKPDELFNEVWLKVGEHEYIYMLKIKLEEKYSV